MKLTKSRLQQIIKEELMKEAWSGLTSKQRRERELAGLPAIHESGREMGDREDIKTDENPIEMQIKAIISNLKIDSSEGRDLGWLSRPGNLRTLKMKLAELGFKEEDMDFREELPIQRLEFSRIVDGEWEEWLLPLEGKRIGQLERI